MSRCFVDLNHDLDLVPSKNAPQERKDFEFTLLDFFKHREAQRTQRKKSEIFVVKVNSDTWRDFFLTREKTAEMQEKRRDASRYWNA